MDAKNHMHKTPATITPGTFIVSTQMCEASQGIFEQNAGFSQIWPCWSKNSSDP